MPLRHNAEAVRKQKLEARKSNKIFGHLSANDIATTKPTDDADPKFLSTAGSFVSQTDR